MPAFLRLGSNIDLNIQTGRAADLFYGLGKQIGKVRAIKRLNYVKHTHGVFGLIGLQRPDQM